MPGDVLMRKQQEMRVLTHQEIAPDVYELVLAGDLLHKVVQAGQFVNVKVGDDSLILRRPISICHINDESSELTLIYKVVGAGTKALSKMKAGGYVDILGPLGTGFDIDRIDVDDVVALVGGGIGVPPLYEAAKQLSGRGNKVIAILGFASKEDVFYQEKFERFTDVSIATMDGSYGSRGHVLELIQAEGIDFDWILGCGPQAMLNNIVAEYKGLKKGFLSLEERMACGIGACYACICELAAGSRMRVCTEGPVFDLKNVGV